MFDYKTARFSGKFAGGKHKSSAVRKELVVVPSPALFLFPASDAVTNLISRKHAEDESRTYQSGVTVSSQGNVVLSARCARIQTDRDPELLLQIW